MLRLSLRSVALVSIVALAACSGSAGGGPSTWPTESGAGIVVTVPPGWELSTAHGGGPSSSGRPSLSGVEVVDKSSLGRFTTGAWSQGTDVIDEAFFQGRPEALQPFTSLALVFPMTGPVHQEPTGPGYETFAGLPGGVVAYVFLGSRTTAEQKKMAEFVAHSAAFCPATAPTSGTGFSNGGGWSNAPPKPGGHAVC